MRLLIFTLLTGLMVGFVGVDAPAQGKNKKKGGNANLWIKELESVRNLLNKANHNYKGHRAEAVHHVTHAIHLLEHGKHHPNPGQHFKVGKEPQNVSDAQLRQAIAQLNAIADQVKAGQHQHEAQVLKAIHNAVQDLKQALKVA